MFLRTRRTVSPLPLIRFEVAGKCALPWFALRLHHFALVVLGVLLTFACCCWGVRVGGLHGRVAGGAAG